MPDAGALRRYDIINSGFGERGYRQLYSKCFNEEIAMLDGLNEFTHVSFGFEYT